MVKDGEIYHLVITDTLISLMINDDISELIQFIDVDVIKPAF